MAFTSSDSFHKVRDQTGAAHHMVMGPQPKKSSLIHIKLNAQAVQCAFQAPAEIRVR
jgi:hypothetical protein